MKIFVTGGTGAVGTAAVRRLVDADHTVTVVGRRADMSIDGAEYRQCDIGDYDSLLRELRGFDAVVHLAAIPNPVAGFGRDVFRVNDLGTFHVFEAAAECGIRRVVGASSINAVGYFFGSKNFPIEYLPVDEDHPVLATDAYSFSKQVMEDIGRYFWHRNGISSVMLRLPGVMSHDRLTRIKENGSEDRERFDGQRTLIDSLLSLPDTERRQELKRIHAGYDELRSRGIMERRGAIRDPENSPISPEEQSFMHSKANFWAYLDDTDSARAIELGATVDYEGSHPLFVNSHRNSLGRPHSETRKLFYPVEPEVRPQYGDDDCLVSIDRARELLGFDPEFTL